MQDKKQYYEKNREAIKIKSQINREATAAEIKNYSNIYYQINKEAISAKKKQYYEANKERLVLRMKINREANKEKILKQSREYKQAVKANQ